VKIVGHSHETPRRWWISFGLGEFRVYRFGIELLLGPVGHFVWLDCGTAGIGVGRVSV
jgi:hypothetical protein